MSKLKYTFMLALSVTLGAQNASANDDHKAAYDKRDNVVTNSFGNCVRTKWETGDDVCAPDPEPAPKPIAAPPPPPPAPKISREHRTIYFDFNKSALNKSGTVKLDKLIGHIAKSDQIIGAGIAGFADRIGSDSYNLELSKKRAKSVYEYLDKRVNIDTRILDIRAFGENESQTDCSKKLKRSEEIKCLQKDRRVEVIFEYKE